MYHVHFGVTKYDGTAPSEDRLPAGFLSDGDSFLCWGEGAKEDDDTLHIIAMEQEDPDNDRLADLRRRLAPYAVGFGERLFDYAVVSDAADWSRLNDGDVYVWTPREGDNDLVY